MKEDHDKKFKLDILHMRETFTHQHRMQEKDIKYDQEYQKLKETYKDKKVDDNEDCNCSTIDREAEQMASFELVEEVKMAEERI